MALYKCIYLLTYLQHQSDLNCSHPSAEAL